MKYNGSYKNHFFSFNFTHRFAFVASGPLIDVFTLPSPVTLNEGSVAGLDVSPMFQDRQQDVKVIITGFSSRTNRFCYSLGL